MRNENSGQYTVCTATEGKCQATSKRPRPVLPRYLQIHHLPIYRVSIKSFPDYEHLLQELYVAPQLQEFQPWIIFQQDGAPPHCGSHVLRFLDATFPNSGLGEMVRHPGHHDRQISPPFTSFYAGMLRTKCFRHQFQILQI